MQVLESSLVKTLLPTRQAKPSGRVLSRVMILGDSPDEREEAQGQAFCLTVGQTLDSLLQDAGILRSDTIAAYVCPYRPLGGKIDQWFSTKKTCPDVTWVNMGGVWVHPVLQAGIIACRQLINEVKPTVIVAMGNLPLWLLTGEWGVKTWRGSLLKSTIAPGATVIPTYHPSQIHQDFSLRPYVKRDLQRIHNLIGGLDTEPAWDFLLRPTFLETKNWLQGKLTLAAEGTLWLGGDFETRSGHIACLGIADSIKSAICIPFMCAEKDDGYFYLHEEQEVTMLPQTND